MISAEYKYKTREGHYDVRLYSFDGNSKFCIHGAIRINGIWQLMSWDRNGKADPVYSMTDGREWDLIKVKPIMVKDKATVIVSRYPAPLPERILKMFAGKRTKITLEEV
jgi:hypothetical protein